MRPLFLFLLLVAVASLKAQNISGFTKDADGKPVTGATISLLQDTGKAVLKLAVSKENGAYSFNDLKPGNYRVSASHVAFQPMVSSAFVLGSTDVTAPEL